MQLVTFRLWIVVLTEESYGKIQVDGPVRQRDNENKDNGRHKCQRENRWERLP